MATVDDFKAAVEQIKEDEEKFHQIVQGSDTTTVPTENGPVDSAAKAIKTLKAQVAISTDQARQYAADAQASANTASSESSVAAQKASDAAQKATEAKASKDAAAVYAGNAEGSATNAYTQSQTAAAQATAAATQATNAAASATTASQKATEATNAASTATQKATEAAASATNAGTSKDSAASSATTATTQATNAAASATDAQNTALALYKWYLGSKNSFPTTDNQGQPLTTGCWFYHTIEHQSYAYNGGAWESNKGSKGDKGDQGVVGPAGPAGSGVSILGRFDSLAVLQTTIPVGNSGDAYMVGTTVPLHMAIWDTPTSTWIDTGPIQGPQGPQGEPGQAGQQGQPGAAASIVVGTTSNVPYGTPAKVTNVGTTTNAVLVFQIPAGRDGVDGRNGIDGTAGPAGRDGVDGAKGETGAAGRDGLDGEDGTNGTNGRDGVDGAAGAPGQAATISVHSTETVEAGTPASVENVGTNTLASLKFKIPQGPQGLQGGQGVPGPVGPKGETQTTANLSAQINGARLSFTLPAKPSAAPALYYLGQKLVYNTEYTWDGNVTVTLVGFTEAPQSGETLEAQYGVTMQAGITDANGGVFTPWQGTLAQYTALTRTPGVTYFVFED